MDGLPCFAVSSGCGGHNVGIPSILSTASAVTLMSSFHGLDVCDCWGGIYNRFQISNDDCSRWQCANTKVLFVGSCWLFWQMRCCFSLTMMMAVIMAAVAAAAKIRWWHIGRFSEARGAILSSAGMVIGEQANVTLNSRFAEQPVEHRGSTGYNWYFDLCPFPQNQRGADNSCSSHCSLVLFGWSVQAK